MIRQLLLPPSVLHDSYCPRPANGSLRGLLQGPQGVLQTLLDLGETFLASELSEVDLQDLEAKLSAARSRDHDAIRDLQKKIEELSGMSAMVSRLKNELQEEKEKAKEDAEDLTQEMAELRYQLMQRVDEERDLRARTEEASLRRIAELEAQLKYSRQETALLLGQKQSAEAQAKACALESQHLKSALDEAKQIQNKLLEENAETEQELHNQQQELQLKITTLQTELTETNLQLRTAHRKIDQLESTCAEFRKENEAALLSLDQKKVEMQLKILEKQESQSEFSSCVLEADNIEDLGTVEEQNSHLLHEVNDMLELFATFKLQLYVLASEYYEVRGRLLLSHDVVCMSDIQESNMPSLYSNDIDEGLLMIRDVACMTDVEENDWQDSTSRPKDETDYVPHDIVCMTDAEESIVWDMGLQGTSYTGQGFRMSHTDQGLHMSPEDVGMANVKEIEIPLSDEIEGNHIDALLHGNKPDIRYERPWTVQVVVDIVDVVTEEMTKLLRILLKCSQSRKPDLLSSLESRLQLWSNIPQKALPEKIIGSGVFSEWGDLVVDMLAQSQRELHVMHQTVEDLEAEMQSLANIRDEFAVTSEEFLLAKEELVRAREQFHSELELKDDVYQMLEGQLEETSLALLQGQEKIAQQDVASNSLHSDLHQLEVEMKGLKAVWISEKKWLEDSLQEQHEAMLKERAKANKDIDKLERSVEELRSRLAENEEELEELVRANDLNIDAVVAAKLRRLSQKLKASQMAEADLQAERAELASQVVWLQAKLEEAERELEAENEQHVEALIQYEEERGLLEAELEAGKQALHSRKTTFVQNAKGKGSAYRAGNDLWVEGMDLYVENGALFEEGEQKQMEKFIGVLKQSILEKDRILAAQKEDLLFQKELNRKLMNESASLNTELLAVQHELALCEAQANDMGSTISNLQEALMVERMKADQAQADIDLQTKRRSEDYLQLKLRLDELLSNIRVMQADLSESRRRESEASAQAKKLGAELLLAKEEAVKSEERFQKALKEIEGQLDAEKDKLEDAISAQQEAELLLSEQDEELQSLEEEKIELQRLLGQAKGVCRQLERERDDFRVAYMDAESQLSRRRGAFAR